MRLFGRWLAHDLAESVPCRSLAASHTYSTYIRSQLLYYCRERPGAIVKSEALPDEMARVGELTFTRQSTVFINGKCSDTIPFRETRACKPDPTSHVNTRRRVDHNHAESVTSRLARLAVGNWGRIKEGVLLASPEITTHHISPESGSTFLVLGSDGLWGGLQERKVCMEGPKKML